MSKYFNTIFIISGPSASGKGSVCEPLRQNSDFTFPVSHTTRPIRFNEKNGTDYYFIDDKKFDLMIENGEFLEYENIHNHRYGTSINEVEKNLRDGKNIILEIDVNGTTNIKKMFNNVVSVFISPPSLKESFHRLKKRKSDNQKSQELRKQRSAMEMARAKDYDYIIINDILPRAQKELLDIVLGKINVKN